MVTYYDDRSAKASDNNTLSVVLPFGVSVNHYAMFNKPQFLLQVLARAGSKAEIARALDLPTPRIAEIFNGKRKLSVEEAMHLAETFNVPPFAQVSAEQLAPVLAACLRSPPKGGWTEIDVQRLAGEIEYGLTLLRSASPNHPSQDAIDLVARVVTDRLKGKRA